MKSFIPIIAASLALAPFTATRAAERVPTKAARPNIVFFLIDDEGFADVGFNGGTDIKTPNIDELAKAGAILDAHYVQPVCSPTRAALLTGRYPTSTGVYNVMNDKRSWRLAADERTLATALREAGYETAICGKWHLGFEPEHRPLKKGFDHQYGFMGGAIDNFNLTSGKGEGEPGRDWYRDDKPSDDHGYSTHLLTKEACRIIIDKPAEKPLFLYVPYGAVHTPHQAPDEYKKPYQGLPGPRKNLAAMTAAVDESIGQIVETLKKKGILENTLIVYSSDNGGTSWGPAGSNDPLRGGKSDIYEGGIRVCAFAAWPGKIPVGIHIEEPVHVVDWFPTLCNLAGASTVQKLPLDGYDIWPVITQGARSPHESIPLIGSREGQYAIRVGDWKLLIDPREFKRKVKSNPVELYNLSDDLAEKNNLAAEQPERVRAMRERLDRWIANPVNPDFFSPKATKGGKDSNKSDDDK